MSTLEDLDREREEERERAEQFTVVITRNGHHSDGWMLTGGWVGLVVAHDGAVPFSSGPTGSREAAWAAVRGFLREWRLAGYRT